MFEEYIGSRLKNRHKAIGLKYAKEHGLPELISKSSYGICFKDKNGSDGERQYLVFRVYYDSRPVYINGKIILGRPEKTITEIELFGEGYDDSEFKEAERIARGYLKLTVE